MIGVPQNDDDTVEQIEAIADVAERPFSYYFQKHFQGKNSRKYDIARLHNSGQYFRL